MVKNICLGKELEVTVVNNIGILSDMAKILADHGINIDAVAGYTSEKNEAIITLITDDNLRASDALKNKGYKSVKENEVLIIELENKAGALKAVTMKLAEHNIDIKYIYGTVCSCVGPARIVFSTSDNEKALVAFKIK